MTMFTTRVELHDATWSDYEALHAAMKKLGFSTKITADNGQTYDLPPAEYNYVGGINSDIVLTKAKQAAGTVKESYAVLVSQSTVRTWYNLNKA